MFDKIQCKTVGEERVEYGCILGSSKLVYVKVGMGGSYLGYEDKYLKIAHRLNERYGCSVLCVSNPAPLPAVTDREILAGFVREQELSDMEIFFFGHSNGGVKGLELGESGIPFSKMVLVNMPLMINFHKTLQRIKAIPKTDIVAIYGEADPSYRYLPLLQNKKFPNVETVAVAGADHNFEGMTEQFIALSELLFK